MTARQKFTKGQRVRLSDLGLHTFFHTRIGDVREGTVVGFGNDNTIVAVVLNGNKPSSRRAYHMDFWEPV